MTQKKIKRTKAVLKLRKLFVEYSEKWLLTALFFIGSVVFAAERMGEPTLYIYALVLTVAMGSVYLVGYLATALGNMIISARKEKGCR